MPMISSNTVAKHAEQQQHLSPQQDDALFCSGSHITAAVDQYINPPSKTLNWSSKFQGARALDYSAAAETCHLLITENAQLSAYPQLEDAAAACRGDAILQIAAGEVEYVDEAATNYMECLQYVQLGMSRLLRACISRARRRCSTRTWMMLQLMSTLSQLVGVMVLLPRELLLHRISFMSSPLPAWALGYALACLASLLPLIRRVAPAEFLRSSMKVKSFEDAPSSSTSLPFNLELGSSSCCISDAHAVDAQPGVAELDAAGEKGDDTHERNVSGCLDFFCAVWFVTGLVWVLGRPASSCVQTSPALYSLCVTLLLLSASRYMMPLLLSCALCCCLQPATPRASRGLNQGGGKAGVSQHKIDAGLPIFFFKRFTTAEPKSFDSDFLSLNFVHGKSHELTCSNEEIFPLNAIGACCICLQRYEENAQVRVLPCSHYFHVHCGDTWLRLNASCPLCKFSLQQMV